MISVITVMGVSGCGKTTVGLALAERLGWQFIESDDYHTQKDIEKMSAGIPLTDADRWPWLRRLNAALSEALGKGNRVVLACSALKATYRQMLYEGIDGGVYVHLKGPFGMILNRMRQRDHFMKAEMLQSQFDALEDPRDALVVDISQPVSDLVEQIVRALELE